MKGRGKRGAKESVNEEEREREGREKWLGGGRGERLSEGNVEI